MLKLDEYHKKLLLFLKNNKQPVSYHNLVHRESTFIQSLLPSPCSVEDRKEKTIATQKTLSELISNGYLWDTTGEHYYGLTSEGEHLIESGFVIKKPLDANTLLKEIYDFHPRIKAVSLKLLNDGSYKEAIQVALVEVIDRVKKVSGNPRKSSGPLDGDPLMNKVFACDGADEPIIKLNSLSDDSDKDEQRGFMYLFKGIVGIRNKKSHVNFIQNDPLKAIDYLALASLLMRVLDDDFLQPFNK